MRLLLAIWVAKCLRWVLTRCGREGTHLPGLVACRIHPQLIGAIAHPERVVVVTGTNGKTTVSTLLSDALTRQGCDVVSNRSGSNTAAGIAAALVSAADWRGRTRAEIGVFELDERSAVRVLPGLRPNILVCTNLTRDSMKRNAHPAYIAWMISSVLPAHTRLVLNADDLIVSSLGDSTNPRVHFSVDRLPGDSDQVSGAAVDAATCPSCGHRLDWEYWRFNHIGKARCSKCRFRAPDAAYRAIEVHAAQGRITLDLDGETRSLALVHDSIVNVYNQVAVAATLDLLQIPRDQIAAVFDHLTPPKTRFNTEVVGGVVLARMLAKGLVGVACSRVFEHLCSLPGTKTLVLTVDEASEVNRDVENTAWVYDADYEYLHHESIRQIVVGGVRRYDQALRLAIAGVPYERIITVTEEAAAADEVLVEGIDIVCNLHSVHNALTTGELVQRRLRERMNDQHVDLPPLGRGVVSRGAATR